VEIMLVTFPLSCVNENNIPFQFLLHIKNEQNGGQKRGYSFHIKIQEGEPKIPSALLGGTRGDTRVLPGIKTSTDFESGLGFQSYKLIVSNAVKDKVNLLEAKLWKI
jgi:hypothetical protein